MARLNGKDLCGRQFIGTLLILLVGLSLGDCTSNRQPPAAARIPAPPPAPAPQKAEKVETPQSPSPVREAPLPPPLVDPAKPLIQKSDLLFEKGRRQFSAGQVEEGRSLFRQALSNLKDSGYDFRSHPELERAYYRILNQIQKIEIQALIRSEDLKLTDEQLTPIEKFSGLNLYTIKIDPALRDQVSRNLLKSRFDIPVVLNDLVLKFLDYYREDGREIMETGLYRSGRYLPLFRKIFREEGLPLDLVYLPHVESLFKPNAFSRAHARGLWQFMLGTARLYGLREDWWIDERSDIAKSTRAAARYLHDLHEQFQNWYLVLAAYNSGPGRIQRVMRRYHVSDYWEMVHRRLIPRDTRNFVPSFLAALIIFKNPQRYGFDIDPQPHLEFEKVRLKEQVDLSVAADLIDVPLNELAALNPELRRGLSPYGYRDYSLKVPPGTGDLLLKRLASLPPEKRIRVAHHRVKEGETLGQIARRFRSSIRAIARMNHIRNVNRIHQGQHLLIPLSGWNTRLAAGREGARPSNHVVRPGDTLYKIARDYGVSVDELLRWNHLSQGQTIYPGQRLRLRAGTRTADSVRGGSQL